MSSPFIEEPPEEGWVEPDPAEEQARAEAVREADARLSQRRPCGVCGHDVLPTIGGAQHADPQEHLPFGDCTCGSPVWPPLVDLRKATVSAIGNDEAEGTDVLDDALEALEMVGLEHADQYLLTGVHLIRSRLATSPMSEPPNDEGLTSGGWAKSPT